MTFQEHLQEMLEHDPEFRQEWERLEPLYSVISAVLSRRAELGLSQADLAAHMGKQQPAIARFEAGNAENPTLGFLQQLAEALDARLIVRLEPKQPAAENTPAAQKAAPRRRKAVGVR